MRINFLDFKTNDRVVSVNNIEMLIIYRAIPKYMIIVLYKIQHAKENKRQRMI